MGHRADLEGTFVGVRDLPIYYQAWCPRRPLRAVVVLVHGMGEHSGRYHSLAMALGAAGYALWGFDHLGHGRSAGQRGYVQDWSDYGQTVQAFTKVVLAQMAQQPAQVPLFMWGHSLGGLIALDYLWQHPTCFQGAIISAPPIHPVGVAKPYLVTFARIFSRFLPRLALNIGLGPETLSRDPQVVRRAKADPLMHSMATLRWGTVVLDAIASIPPHIPHIKTPMLLIHGDADQINDVSGSQALYNWLTVPDKTLQIYPGGYHELHHDLDQAQVIAAAITWLNDRIK